MLHRCGEYSECEGHGEGDLLDGIDDGGIVHPHHHLVIDSQNGASSGNFHSIVIVVDSRDSDEKSIHVILTTSESDTERRRYKCDNDGSHDSGIRRGLKGRFQRIRESSVRDGHEGFMATVAELLLHSINEVDCRRVLGMRRRLQNDFQTEDEVALIALLLFVATVNGSMTAVVLTVERVGLRREKGCGDCGWRGMGSD